MMHAATVDDGSCAYGPVLSQIDLPVTWDDATVDYTVTPFGGTTASLSADPINASNTVLMVDRTAGSPTWAGTTIGTSAGFATDIPLTLTNSTMSVILWSPQAGVPIRLKVEDSNDPTHTCETEVVTTVANGWDTLVFDFSNEAPGTQPLSIGLGFGWTFNMASIFCDFGNVPSSSTIYYIDDITFGGVASGVSGCMDATANNYDASATTDDGSCMYDVTFTVDLNCAGFAPGSVALTGPSDGWSCGAYSLSDANGDGVWEGTFSLAPGSFEYIYCADGWAQNETAGLIAEMQAGGTCAPVTDYASYANRLITVGAITTADTWGSCSACVTGGPVSGCTDATATNYDASATVDDGSCIYGPSTYNVTLSVNTANITVGPNGMYAGGGVLGDAVAVPLSDPNGTGTWTGVVTLNAGTTGNYIFLNSPANGGDWGTKEDLSGQSCADPNNWNDRILPNIISDTTLLHCFGSCESDGSCSVYGCTDPTANNYDASATVDDGSCAYGPVLSQIDLPVTWDDATVDYTVTPFGGTTASLSADPINASNTVLMVDRTAGSPTWAGTTIGTSAGFATDIPLTLTNSTMSVILWSPQAGVPIRLKVEDSNDPTHTCETEVVTTVANGWDTLVFDFSNEAPGTQPLSIGLGFGWTFNMASIFCDFGNVPSSSTIYYIDDITFGGVASGVSGCMDATANNYDASATTDDGSCMYDVTFTVDLNCAGFAPGSVALTGPSDGWSCGAYSLSDANGDGVWEGTFSLAPGSFEYIYCADGWAQNETAGLIAEMQAGGTCAPVTDYASYANRLITVGAITTADTWGSCSACVTGGPVSGCTDPAADNYDANATTR